MVGITLRGDDEVRRYLLQLPAKLDKQLSRGNLDFMKRVKKSAKLRAPRASGELSSSIYLDLTKSKGKTKQYKIVVDSPYGIYQELGYAPHWINALQSSKNKLGTVGNALDIAGFTYVSENSLYKMSATTSGTYNMYGDEVPRAYTISKIYGVVNDISGDETWNVEGRFSPGDKIFFVSNAEEITESTKNDYYIVYLDQEYKIFNVLQPIVCGTIQVKEIRCKRR